MKEINISKNISDYKRREENRRSAGYYKANTELGHNKYSEARYNECVEAAKNYDRKLIESASHKKLIAEVEAAQNHCKERIITNMDQIFRAVIDLENKLSIPKTCMEGMIFDVDLFAQKFPNAYKYTPYSTHFEVIVKNGKYYITNVYRGSCRRKVYIVSHTAKSAEAILERFKNF